MILSQTRQIMGHNKVTFGTGGSLLHRNKMKYGTERGHFWGQEKLTYGHNETNFGTE